MKYKQYLSQLYIVFPFAILLIFLRIDLIASNTLPTGGDMGAHIVPTKFFVEELFFNFKINGWSNDWFAGYPAYYFYFPLPPIIVGILNLILPFGVSFKIMVLTSLVLLVVSIERLINSKKLSFSYIGFAGGLIFLLTESFTIFGGNLASSLAGQYSFTFSLAFANLSIYFISNPRKKHSAIISSILLGLCLLSHIIPFLIYAPIYLIYFLFSKSNKIEKISGFFMFLFIALPFSMSLFLNLEFTTNMTYSPYTKIKDLVKPDILPFLIGTICYLIYSSKSQVIKFFLSFEMYLIFISSILFFYGPEGALWNGRLVPFFNLGIIILFFKVMEEKVTLFSNKLQGKNLLSLFYLTVSFYLIFNFVQRWEDRYYLTAYFVGFLSLIAIIIYLNQYHYIFGMTIVTLTLSSVSFLPHWLNWNFTGYEGKENWNEITDLYSGLNQLSPGRVMWEPNSDLNEYGTPMVLMTIPLFTNHESVEGLYFDSSITTPFHFVAVSGLAESPSNPVGGLSYINGDFDKGIRYMKELGVDYFISYTDSITDKAFLSDDLENLFQSPPFTVFRINSSKVEVIDDELIQFSQPQLLERISNSVFKKPTTDSFFTLSMKEFKLEKNRRIIENISISQIDTLNEKVYTGSNISDINISNEKITFYTNHPGYLHIIRVSYFPNWEIANGSGPYRISPSFMAVIPNTNNVEITFETTILEKGMTGISLFSLFAAMYLFYFRIRKHV